MLGWWHTQWVNCRWQNRKEVFLLIGLNETNNARYSIPSTVSCRNQLKLKCHKKVHDTLGPPENFQIAGRWACIERNKFVTYGRVALPSQQRRHEAQLVVVAVVAGFVVDGDGGVDVVFVAVRRVIIQIHLAAADSQRNLLWLLQRRLNRYCALMLNTDCDCPFLANHKQNEI